MAGHLMKKVTDFGGRFTTEMTGTRSYNGLMGRLFIAIITAAQRTKGNAH